MINMFEKNLNEDAKSACENFEQNENVKHQIMQACSRLWDDPRGRRGALSDVRVPCLMRIRVQWCT